MAPLWCVTLLLCTVTGCNDSQRGNASAAMRPSGEPDTVTGEAAQSGDKDLVLRARAYDRADNLDSARILYEEAARRVLAVSDWLYLRAAGVTTDKGKRDEYFRRLKLPAAIDRKGATEALAIERGGDIDAAIVAYTAIGDRLAALRLRLLRPADTAGMLATRRGLVSFLSGNPTRDDARDGIALFDKVFMAATPAENLALARSAYAAGLADRALAGYSRAFSGGTGTARDHFNVGLMLARLNRDADAIVRFNRVLGPPSLAAAARYQRARALLALGRREAARSALRAITTAYPLDTSAASALLLLSDLATDDSRDADARSTLLTLVRRFPRERHAPAALFRAGLVAYIRGDYRTAAAELDSLVMLYPNSADALAAGYWSGRSWKQRGDAAAANARWRAVMAKEGGSYYSVQSARRLGVPLLTDRSRADDYPAVPEIGATTARIAILRDFGMDTEATFENGRLFSDASLTPERLVATAHAFAGTDQAARAIALGRRAVNEIGPTPQNYRLMYPVLERPTLIRSSRASGLDPALVAALIRQESNFNPQATSPVGARGLMQLMPSVGRSIARSRGVSAYTDDSLYSAAINIRLGTAHLADLFRRGSKIERVLAAYNAGESRVARWAQKEGADDPELFTERIPFIETRDYVRAVVRNRAFYAALYDW